MRTHARLLASIILASSLCFVQLASAQSAIQASVSTPAEANSAYKLGPGDEVHIAVFNEPDLSVQQKISANGQISVPLIGDVAANGLSTEELSHALAERFQNGFLRNPRVSVSVITYRPFYVIGEVNNPGAFPYTANLTIESAIATAGGFNHRASRNQVFVKHQGDMTEHAYPLTAAVDLQPGDTIRIGQSFLATLSDLPLGAIPH